VAWNSNRRNAKFRAELVQDFRLLIAALLALGQHSELPKYSETAEVAAELVRAIPEDYDAYLDAAACLSDCAARAMQDKRLTEEQRKALADEYSRKAVEFIQGGIKKGFKKFKELRDSPTYNPIRDREDFKKLLHDLEQTESSGVG
jgi:hypothetical protein